MQFDFSLKTLFTFLLVALLTFPVTTFGTHSLTQVRSARKAATKPKLAPDLEEILAQDDEDERQALQGKTLAQVRQERLTRAAHSAQSKGDNAPQRQRINGQLLPSTEVLPEEKQSFIIQV
ncbi:MAG TPA: hypothetical protein VFZ34_04240, partial [Blastocatellia bacterium]|nr:hypothetical protein [Blastocatellia bacterium]